MKDKPTQLPFLWCLIIGWITVFQLVFYAEKSTDGMLFFSLVTSFLLMLTLVAGGVSMCIVADEEKGEEKTKEQPEFYKYH